MWCLGRVSFRCKNGADGSCQLGGKRLNNLRTGNINAVFEKMSEYWNRSVLFDGIVPMI